MTPNAYLKYPSLHQDIIIFITDDDLWSVSKSGGKAHRLTTTKGQCSQVRISPNGQLIAYLSNHHGQNDIYIIPIEGGTSRRITFLGVQYLSSWSTLKKLCFASSHENFNTRQTNLFEVEVETLNIKKINIGPGSYLEKSGETKILGRNIGDPARWKRYRGGTAGTLWVAAGAISNFRQILKNLPTNLANPKIIGKRLYFISDHEGYGNIYSSTFRGTNIKRHTHHSDFYIRNFEYFQDEIVYQSGANLYLFNIKENIKNHSPLLIDIHSTFNQAITRFESAANYLQTLNINNHGNKLTLTTRGQLFIMSPWSGAPKRIGLESKRYKLPTFVTDNKKKESLVAVEFNQESEETLRVFDLKYFNSKLISGSKDWGKIYQIKPSPNGKHLVISNNRAELFLIDLKTLKVKKIDQGSFSFFQDMSWSPCSQFIAYSYNEQDKKRTLYLYDLKKKKKIKLIKSVLSDSEPVFSPCGDYLYFNGIREFHPNYAETHFELSFPFATKIYGLCLTKETPFSLNLFNEYQDEDLDESKNDKKPIETIIDFTNIEDRVFSFSQEMGGISEIFTAKDKVFYLKEEIIGHNPHSNSESQSFDLYCYDLKEKKEELWESEIIDIEISNNCKFFICHLEDGVRLISTDSKPSEGECFSKKDGYINTNRVSLKITPKDEWVQMFQEAWILQREHFWSEDMAKIDWVEVYERYYPLIQKVNTRHEMSDLLWEMQGELGTSHCYEFLGDYNKRPPQHKVGSLGATFNFKSNKKALEVVSIAKGDSWIPSSSSPLRSRGVDIEIGDLIYSIDGEMIKHNQSLFEHLENKISKEVSLIIQRKNKKIKEEVSVFVKNNSGQAHYRDWVEKNREYVHKKSEKRFGYVHIPDMSIQGFSEFYRQFLSECSYEGLIVDVRFNGGGNVSQHILKILAQKIVGFDQTRYFGIESYPSFAINGPIVALTNEHAGSDGDIFSHSFKLMKIGKLVGKRTWGGVIGIWPRTDLVDGTRTTQPEFSFWFKDVGYAVENYGTEPDVEVEITPKDYMLNKDTQLDMALEVCRREHQKSPPIRPNLKKNRPSLKPPKLPR